ncbi:hypothetical protein [Vulgatibacter sp.]|uniref:hypothetical protein n=1 Tax=Vulgatibacter sp. TaxID=1971226 RepID=UPI00356A7EBF
MTPGEHEAVSARLVAPPPVQARLVRPPRQRALRLVGAALAQARHLRLPWLLLGAARLLRAAGWSAPLVVLVGGFRAALARLGDPFAAAVHVIADPAVLLPAFGLGASALLAGALVELAGLALGLPALAARLGTAPAPSPQAATFGPRLAALLQTGALLLLAACVWAAAVVPLLAVAAQTWLASRQASGAGALLASVGLALVGSITLGGSLLFRLAAEAALVRVGAFGGGPLAGIYEGFALVLRKPAVLLGAVYLVAVAGALAGLAFGIPAALSPPGAAGFALRAFVELATAGATALLALARLGVFVQAAAETRP